METQAENPLTSLPPERHNGSADFYKEKKCIYAFLIGSALTEDKNCYRVAWIDSRDGTGPDMTLDLGFLEMTLRDFLTQYVVEYDVRRLAKNEEKVALNDTRDGITHMGGGRRQLNEPLSGRKNEAMVYTLSPLRGNTNPRGISSLDVKLKDICWLNRIVREDTGHESTEDDVMVWSYGFRLSYTTHMAGGSDLELESLLED